MTAGRRGQGAATNLYTYLVVPVGPIVEISAPERAAEIRFLGALTRSDGATRQQSVVVRPTDLRPDLVDRVRAAIRDRKPMRLVVAFQRIAVEEAGVVHLRNHAVVDAILDAAARAKPARDDKQLSLFG